MSIRLNGARVADSPVTDYGGRVIGTATLYRGRDRAAGRRIVLRGPDGAVLFDSDDCFDSANAQNKLDFFLARHLGPSPRIAARFESGWVPAGPGLEAEMFKTWKERRAKEAEAEAERWYDDGGNCPGEGGGGGE